jgi:hypothetical protein
MVKRNTLPLILGVLALVSCGSFAYKHYGLDLPSYEKGRLLGPEEKYDLPISVCEPDEQAKGKCICYLEPEHERLMADMIELRKRLEACEED